MKRILSAVFALLVTYSAIGQTTESKRIIANDSLKIKTNWIKSILTDTALTGATSRDIASADAIKTYIANRLALVVKYGDTAALVAGYVRETRFLDSLAAVQGRLNTKLNISDSLAMLAGYARVNRLIDTANAIQARLNNKLDASTAASTYVTKTTTVNGHALSSNITVSKSDVGLSNVPNTDATNAANISSGTLADGRLSGNVTLKGNSFNGANQLPLLDGSGKLVASVIPALALVDTYTPASQAAMLALPAEQGDFAIRTDINAAFVLYQSPASTLSNWIQLPAPSSETDPVFTAHVAYSITSTNISNWNTAYGWGNHASAGYTTASNTQTFTNKSGNISQWTNNVGYLTSYTETDPTIYSWAKASTKPSYSYGEISGTPSSLEWSRYNGGYSSGSLTATLMFNSTSGKFENVSNATVKTALNIGDGSTLANSISGNAATATNSNQWGGYTITNTIANAPDYILGYKNSAATTSFVTAAQLQTFIGLGSNAYTSTSFLPTAGGNMTGPILPATNASYDFGSSSYRWATVYSYHGNFNGNVTVSGNIYTPGLTSSSSAPVYMYGLYSGNEMKLVTAAGIQSFLSLGSAAYLNTDRFVYGDAGTAANYTTGNANNIFKAGFYTFFNGTSVPGGDFGMLSIPTFASNSSSSRYNLQIGGGIGGNVQYRSTDINGAGTWYTLLSSYNYNSYAMAGAGYSANQNLNTSSNVTFATIDASLIRSTGDVIAYYSSDRRFKNNIRPINNALNAAAMIGGYSFDWNDKQDIYTGHDYGVIAQDVERYFPELVTTRSNGYKAVKYEKLPAVAFAALREAKERIEALEADVKKLKRK